MISRRAAAPVVIALVALGSLCVAVRAHFRQGQSFVPGDSLWRLSYSAEFHARKANARLRAPIPKSTRHSWVFHHDVDYGQLQQEHMRPSETDGHEIAAVAAKPGQFTLTAHFDIQLSPHASWRGRTTETGLSARSVRTFSVATRTRPSLSMIPWCSRPCNNCWKERPTRPTWSSGSSIIARTPSFPAAMTRRKAPWRP